MAVLGPTVFGAVLWGSILGVAVVFAYQVYAVGRDAGLVG